MAASDRIKPPQSRNFFSFMVFSKSPIQKDEFIVGRLRSPDGLPTALTIHYNGRLARRRFFVTEIHNGTAELTKDDARHLTRVLRVEPGQRFEISDNHAAWLAEVTEARGERVVFRVLEPIESPAAPVHITLIAAIVKF